MTRDNGEREREKLAGGWEQHFCVPVTCRTAGQQRSRNVSNKITEATRLQTEIPITEGHCLLFYISSKKRERVRQKKDL